MDERQHRTVQKFRSQVDTLKNAYQQFVGETENDDALPTSQLAPETLKAKDDLHRKSEEYATYRLREGLGPDPVHIDEHILSETLKGMVSKSRLSALITEDVPMRISTAARQDLMLLNFSFAESDDDSVKNDSGLLSLLNERSPMKDAFRRWASQIKDEYIMGTLEQLQRLDDNRQNTVELLLRRLDRLRRRYEDELETVDDLAVERLDGQTVIRTSNSWSNLASNFPEDIQEVYAIFRTLENQIEEIEEIKAVLNGELRKFIASVIPYYIAYVQQQKRSARRTVLRSQKAAPKLVEKMVREAKQTDYLRTGGGLRVPHPKIPKEFSAIRKMGGYQNFARTANLDKMRSDDTVEFSTNR